MTEQQKLDQDGEAMGASDNSRPADEASSTGAEHQASEGAAPESGGAELRQSASGSSEAVQEGELAPNATAEPAAPAAEAGSEASPPPVAEGGASPAEGENPSATAQAEAAPDEASATPETSGEAPELPADEASATSETSSEAPERSGEASEQDAAQAEVPAAAASDSSGDGSETAGAQESGTQQPTPGKKKRRRRRKKKPGGEAEASADKPSHRPPERTPFHVGEEVFGKVTAVIDTAIMADLSGKALAIFDRSEMEPDDLVPATGDRFVARVHSDGGRGGLVVLTRKPLRDEEIKPVVEQAAKDGTLVSGLITGAIKGGVEVDIYGLRAFAPASGMDLHPANANFTTLVGQRMDFKVLQYDKQGRNVVVTRRPMLEAEAHERRKHALTLLEEGQVLKGVVRTIVEWGIFVAMPEVENLEGLVHVTEVSHDARPNLAEQFKPGDKFDVKILKIDDRGKIWLSRKALMEDPWAHAKEKYAVGTRHKAKVERLEPFGVFIGLEPGIDGFIHVSDLAFDRVEHPQDVVKEGEEMEVVVAHFDVRNKKVALHPAPKPEHADEERQKLVRNAPVKAEVVKGESSGLTVRLLGMTGRGARGFVPAGQTGTMRGTDLRKKFRPGTILDLKVLDSDPKRGQTKLSIRGLKEDEERRAHREYRQKLKEEGGFGTLGDLFAKKLRSSGDGS